MLPKRILGLQLSKIMRQAAESIWFEIYRGVVDPGRKILFFPRNFRKFSISPENFPRKFLTTLFLVFNSKISVYPVTIHNFATYSYNSVNYSISLQKSPLSNVLALHNNIITYKKYYFTTPSPKSV